MDKSKHNLRIGDRVQITNRKDGFYGQTGQVKTISEVLCGIDINGYYATYSFEHLKPLN